MVFPPKCFGCAQQGSWACDECWGKLALIKTPICYRCQRLSPGFAVCQRCRRSSPLRRLVVAGYWQNPLRAWVLALKYRRARVLSRYLTALLIDALQLADVAAVDVVVPVPLHYVRRFRRGFNQAQELAQLVAGHLRKPLVASLLRVRNTKPQFSLSRWDRLSNVAGAFDVNPAAEAIIKNRTILVVDDVITTGATIEECARSLKQKGAKAVWGLVLAKA